MVKGHATKALIDLGQNRVDDVAVDVGETAVRAVVTHGELFVVDAEEMQDRGVNVVDIVLLDSAPRPLIARAVGNTTTDASAGEPLHARAAIVVASFGPLTKWMAAELGAPDHKCIREQTTFFQIGQ